MARSVMSGEQCHDVMTAMVSRETPYTCAWGKRWTVITDQAGMEQVGLRYSMKQSIKRR
jgi:hypothetical protein